jgi:hypothetical protein
VTNTTVTAPREKAPPDRGSATAASPSGHDLWRAARAPLLIAAAIGIVVALIAIANPGGRQGLLDPDAVDNSGSHALATLLHDHGVEVTRVTTLAEAQSLAGAATTLLVTRANLLPPQLMRDLAETPADLVVLAPGDPQLGAMGVPARAVGDTSVQNRAPDCALPAAESAGAAEMGGVAYIPTAGTDVLGCYHQSSAATLLEFTRADKTVTILGSGAPWTNGRLAHSGDAALGLHVLGANPRVVWLVPSLRAAVAAAGHRSLTDLLPDRVLLVVGQLAIAVLLLALWRARRLGPVVTEPLPVAVRAAETVEGRARLYRASHARDRAADALRIGCRSRLTTVLGLPTDTEPPALVATVAGRTRRAESAVRDLLYGAAPDGDPALVRLADDLDALAREVRRP